eukprot:88196-Chlamydomonas_euryale.AAC.1
MDSPMPRLLTRPTPRLLPPPPGPALSARHPHTADAAARHPHRPPATDIVRRGPSNFCGYYKDQKKTDEDVEEDGWFHSGDIAVFTPEGGVKIVDRKKNIFKLSQ